MVVLKTQIIKTARKCLRVFTATKMAIFNEIIQITVEKSEITSDMHKANIIENDVHDGEMFAVGNLDG